MWEGDSVKLGSSWHEWGIIKNNGRKTMWLTPCGDETMNGVQSSIQKERGAMSEEGSSNETGRKRREWVQEDRRKRGKRKIERGGGLV